MRMATLLLAAVLGTRSASASLPLDDYMNRAEAVFDWYDTGTKIVPPKRIFTGTVHLLNVTSLSWLNSSIVSGPNGAVWSHQVAVIVPEVVKTNRSLIYLTGGCNENPSVPEGTDEELLLISRVSQETGAVGVVVWQIPNCHLTFASDPSKKGRGEDALLAWAWKDYLDDPLKLPERLPRLPMAKAAFQCMRAVTAFAEQQKLASINGWLVSGASKRGWTTWMVGSAAAGCPTCPSVIGLAPLVPIVPSIQAEVHLQWRSYGGFTFAFSDYADAGIIPRLDSPEFDQAAAIIDPINYVERLNALPKVIVDSSDDEFMQFDWTQIWDGVFENTRLLIAANSEHSLATGIPQLLPCLTSAFSYIDAGMAMPSFETTYDKATGSLTVSVPGTTPAKKVTLHHAQTHSTVRRDFRWVRLANNETGECKLPDVPLPKPMFGGNCLQPIVWHKSTLEPSVKSDPLVEGGAVSYTATPPEPTAGHWTGYFVEVEFESPFQGALLFTTPGYAWPNTLPFDDCHGEECQPILV